MIVSMTGYGKGEGTAANAAIIVEIRSVNHRYAEVNVKVPRSLLPMENEIRKRVAEKVRRGKVEVYVQLEERTEGDGAIAVNVPLARGYHAALAKLREELGIEAPVPLSMIAGQRDVLMTGETKLDE